MTLEFNLKRIGHETGESSGQCHEYLRKVCDDSFAAVPRKSHRIKLIHLSILPVIIAENMKFSSAGDVQAKDRAWKLG